ncbi:Sulfite reductase [NADPH] flavoprotein alpha-component [Anatilimnocola aggregata]|uniref:assimilatory sulfite reductase (NADPH) n=1 Tax=Anatilimnocola aggregata TaxID=2528021 RepID=A0A517Y680_9BACT|nr:sulfite reductase subunit alpha [Anatilimnocola aggregata]QDU25741.1 Sulfite reductase [NADPH] flavoprotein alpha-component [Anatilimnocola aggregata]
MITNVPVIPESAPFNPQQRAWLNGFFAAILSGQSQSPIAGGSMPATSPPAIAAEEDFPWHDSTLPIAERLTLAEGKPIERQLMAAMAQLDCGACGYLCQTYSEAIARGEEKDLTRCSPGGNDTAKALKQLLSINNSKPAPATNGHAKGTNGHAAPAPQKYSRTSPFAAKLISNERLTQIDAPKDTRHVVIDLLDSGIAYQAGDSLGILPVNCPELVKEVLQQLGASGDEPVKNISGETRRIADVLANEVTLARSRPDLLELLAKHAQVPGERETLAAAVAEGGSELLGYDLAELLAKFPSARPSLDDFLAALTRLQPRLYSISSSQLANPKQVTLTVGVVKYESQGRWKHGVASHFLGVRSLPGDDVRVFVQPSPKFRLPSDPTTPVIMVGPGTGIAPFRAFLQERQALGLKGPAWLFFGNQHFDYDFLYRDELSLWLDQGVLSRLDLAFSRDQAEKLYVQHKMLDNAADLWQWLQQGAHFFVCGDAKKMAADVDQVLQAIVMTQGGKTAAEAKQYVAQMAKDKRYHKDVY